MISSLPGLAHEILQCFFLLFPDINWFILSTWLLFVLLSCLNWVVFHWSFLPRRAVHGEPLVPELLLGTELHVARGHGCMCGSNRIKMDQVSMDQKWALHILGGSMINGNLGKFTCIKVTYVFGWPLTTWIHAFLEKLQPWQPLHRTWRCHPSLLWLAMTTSFGALAQPQLGLLQP